MLIGPGPALSCCWLWRRLLMALKRLGGVQYDRKLLLRAASCLGGQLADDGGRAGACGRLRVRVALQEVAEGAPLGASLPEGLRARRNWLSLIGQRAD